MKAAMVLTILELLFLWCCLVSGQGCLRALNSDSVPVDPPFKDKNSIALSSTYAVQAIVTSYQFYCDCVNITRWETFVQPGSWWYRRTRPYDITFQLWRPSPTVNETGCYSLVGENQFKSVDISGSGLVRLSPTPPANPFLVANAGDVVGYITNSRRNSNEGIQLEQGAGYSDNSIWYHDYGADGILVFNSMDSNCQVTVGNGIDKTLRRRANAAPMLRIKTTSANPCPIIPSSVLHSETPSSINKVPTATIKRDMERIPSDTLQSIQSSMNVPNGNGSSNRRSNVLRLAIIVPVVVVLCALIATLILLILLLRMKKISKNMSNDNILDFSNPNYATASLQAIQSERNWSRRPQSNQLSKENQANARGNEEESVCYDTVDIEESLDCKYSDEMTSTSRESAHIYEVYSTVDHSDNINDLQKLQQADTPLYHIVGPDSARAPSNTVTPDSETREYVILEGENRLYHVLEDENSDSNSTELSQTKAIFDSSGFHVPTQEERSKTGPNTEHTKKTSKSPHYYKLKFFDEEEMYWAPATTTTALYSQLAAKKYREVPRSQIRLGDLLGTGEFGEVYKAQWSIDQHKLELAVKTLKHEASEEDGVKFLQEAAIMGQFNHRNVIKMHGVVTLGEPIYICLELLNKGDLNNFLNHLQSSNSNCEESDIRMMFLKFSKDIAAGMEYLSRKCFVHRDLAARNILLNEALTCKVADFGMARNLMDDTYYTSSGGKIPVKWTAPEALLYNKYSTDSDVWSYGMVLFEIWSVGEKPFFNLTNSQFLQAIQKGYCQAPPPCCPRAIYALMVDCWNPVHQCRPTFKYIFREYLKQPSSMLLYFEDKEDNVSHTYGTLEAAPIEEGQPLYTEIQNKYKSNDATLNQQ